MRSSTPAIMGFIAPALSSTESVGGEESSGAVISAAALSRRAKPLAKAVVIELDIGGTFMATSTSPFPPHELYDSMARPANLLRRSFLSQTASYQTFACILHASSV